LLTLFECRILRKIERERKRKGYKRLEKNEQEIDSCFLVLNVNVIVLRRKVLGPQTLEARGD
jgi:hypothetical protein